MAQKILEQYTDKWYAFGNARARDMNATLAQAVRADELYPQVLAQLVLDKTIQNYSAEMIYDYCFVDENTSIKEIVEELEAAQWSQSI